MPYVTQQAAPQETSCCWICVTWGLNWGFSFIGRFSFYLCSFAVSWELLWFPCWLQFGSVTGRCKTLVKLLPWLHGRGRKSWEGSHAVFGVPCLRCSITTLHPFPQLCCLVSFWELMALWSSRQELIKLRASIRTSPGKLPVHLPSVTAQWDESLARMKRVVGGCIWDRLDWLKFKLIVNALLD